jgi:hypothetical protein
MAAPDSSYSALVIHMEAKVLRLERIDPPIQTLNLLSGGATTYNYNQNIFYKKVIIQYVLIFYSNFHGVGGQFDDFRAQSGVDTLVHSGSSRHNNVSVKVLSDVEVTRHNRIESEFVHSWDFLY